MDYAAHWSTIMNKVGRQAEIIGSINQQTLNGFLEKHFQKDKEHYAFTKEFTFNDGQQNRTFKLGIQAKTPIKLDLAPYNMAADPEGWNAVRSDLETDGAELGTDPNLLVSMDKLTISLSWDGGAGSLPPLDLALDGQLRLYVQPNMDGKYALFTDLHLIRFRQAAMETATKALTKQMASAGTPLVADQCQELIIIMLNIVANNYAPRTIESLELPAPEIGDLPSVAAFLDISDDVLTIGYDTDRAVRNQAFLSQVEENFVQYEAALMQDISNAGSLEALLFPDGTPTAATLAQLEPLSEAALAERMPATTAMLAALDKKGKLMSVASSPKAKAALAAALVDRGFAVGVNEYALDAMAGASLDQNRRAGTTRWINLAIVKGRAGYWAQLKNPDVSLSGTPTDARLGGSIFVDVGAYIEACVRRILRCSTSWSCSRAGLSLVGPGEVSLNLNTNGSDGVVIGGKLERLPKFHADLPFPFNKVVEALLNLVLQAIKVIVNSVLAFLRVRVISKEISLPSQKTKLKLGQFAAGYAEITVPGTGTVPSQTRYLAVGAEATAG